MPSPPCYSPPVLRAKGKITSDTDLNIKQSTCKQPTCKQPTCKQPTCKQPTCTQQKKTRKPVRTTALKKQSPSKAPKASTAPKTHITKSAQPDPPKPKRKRKCKADPTGPPRSTKKRKTRKDTDKLLTDENIHTTTSPVPDLIEPIGATVGDTQFTTAERVRIMTWTWEKAMSRSEADVLDVLESPLGTRFEGVE